MSELRYRADVDGLRAVAVSLVLLFHAGFGWTGGFIGVDVFFVISGYLITGLILRQQAAGTFNLRNFWARRIRRILPASLLVVGATLLIGKFVLGPSDYKELAQSTVAQQLMVANVFFWRQVGYFAGSAEVKPLMHTWSLAVEEQFYLGFPLLLIVLNRCSRKTTARVLVGLTLLSFGTSQLGVYDLPRAAFFLLPSRAWEMLLGGLIWFAPPATKIGARQREFLSWLAMGGILVAGWYYDSQTLFPGVAALLPCASAAVLIYVNSEHRSRLAKLLSAKPVVFVGLISYSLYLWHWPVLAFFRYERSEPLSVVARLGILLLSFVAAYLSYRFVETPWRKAPRFQTKRALIAAGVGVGAVLFLANRVVDTMGVWTFYYPELSESNVLTDGDDENHFDVLFLGGSVLQQVVQEMKPETLAPLAPPGANIRIYDLTVASHTSRDSVLKMRLLQNRAFDVVFIYQGINDARMNCCEDDAFRDDYTHCEWYDSMTARVAANKITLTDMVTDTADPGIGLGEPTKSLAQLGTRVKTVPAFRSNVNEIVSLASKSPRTKIVLATFAMFLTDDYSRERFDNHDLGYSKGHYSMPVESWGTPDGVRKAVAAHNAVVREIANENPRVMLLDQEQHFSGSLRFFSDLCHLSDAGCEEFTSQMLSLLAHRNSVEARQDE